MLGESDYLFISITTILGLSLTQALIVLPVAPAKIDRAARPSWARCLLASAALGLIATATFYFAMAACDATNLFRPPDVLTNPIAPPFAIIASLAGLAAGLWIRWRCARGIPIMLSLVMLGLIAALIVTGAALTLAEGLEQLASFQFSTAGWVVLTTLAVLIPWTLGTLMIRAYLRRTEPDQVPEWGMTRLARWLFAGSVVELVATIPLDVMVRRRTSCYCSEGTFWSLILAATAGLAALGPMIFFLPVARRRQRAFKGLCPSCGYDRRSLTPHTPCPECGTTPMPQ
jgi:hypothetical protein